MVFQLVVNTLNVFLLCLLGWAANSNYSFIGCLRSLAQVLSYEIILNSILLIIIFSSNTWTYSELMEYQIDLNHAYGIFSLELIFIIIIIAEINWSTEPSTKSVVPTIDIRSAIRRLGFFIELMTSIPII